MYYYNSCAEQVGNSVAIKMAAENVKVVCAECESVVSPGEDVIVTIDRGVVHAKCALCASCGNPFDKYIVSSTDTTPKFDYAMVHRRPFHLRCLICHNPQCTDDINAVDIVAYPEFFVRITITCADGLAWRVIHTWCRGCSCESCDKDKNNRMNTPLSRWDSSYSVQRYSNGVLDPAHRQCNNCLTQMGIHGTGLWSRCPQDVLQHARCMKCTRCIRADEREIKDNHGLSYHETCLTCPVCCLLKDIGLNTRRRFVMNVNGQLVHNDCVQCDLCGVTKDNYYTRPVANITRVNGNGPGAVCTIDPTQPHVLVHENCPKGALKRKRDAEPVDPFARTRSERKCRGLK